MLDTENFLAEADGIILVVGVGRVSLGVEAVYNAIHPYIGKRAFPVVQGGQLVIDDR